MENYQELRRSIGALLMQCDGAATLDGTGFNKVDSPFARSLYNQCFWTHRQAQAAYKMLTKYKGQLSDLGFSISPPAEEPRSSGNPSPSEKALKIEGAEARVIFRCGREEFQSILSAVRTIPGRKFDAGSKTWTVPINDYSMSVLEGLGFDVPKKEKVEKEIQLPTGLSYMPFQLEGISRLVQMDGRGLLADEMGCIDGESIIQINRGGGSKKIKLKDAYKRLHQQDRHTYNWDRNIPTHTRSMGENGFIRLNEIITIIDKGMRSCVEVQLESGKALILTPDHEVFCGSKWTPIGELKENDFIAVNGINTCKNCGSTKDVITYERAKYIGFCKKCMYSLLRRHKNDADHLKRKGTDGYIYLKGTMYHGHPRYTTGGLLEHVFIAEKMIGRPLKDNEEVHHINRIRDDNREENLIIMTRSEHRKIHGSSMHFGNFIHRNGSEVVTHTKEEKIVSIKDVGFRHVFDIVMKSPNHNFIANGIAVHNCGKTIQALGYMAIKKEQRPALIIVPASLKINWERELKKWLPGEKAKIINGRSDSLGDNISIINYDILKDYVQKAKDAGVQLIILDECHMTKNRKAQRTKAVREVCKGVSHVIAMSGTPITNRPAEFFNILSILNPQMFGSFWHYAQEYCGAVQGRFGWDFSGATNTERLHQILTKTLMIRRLKKDVLAQLPKKRRSIIPLEINNRKEYNSAQEDIISWLTDTEGEEVGRKASQAETLVRIERLKQLAFEGKVQSALEWIENFLEQEDKLVVFATHHKAIDVLMEKFQGIAVKVDGRDTQEARQKAVDEFQNNADIKLFIGNIKAAGVGLTLTAASSTAFIEFGWTPGDHDQAEDRVHRIGQEAESVNAYYLVGVDTIDEDICSLIDHKRKILDSVLDGHDTEDEALLTELIKELKRKAA